MRLQSAIFTLPDALLDGGALRPGADKVLSILKMESVWLYAVTALDRAEAQALLRSAGIEGDFRGLLTEREAGCRLQRDDAGKGHAAAAVAEGGYRGLYRYARARGDGEEGGLPRGRRRRRGRGRRVAEDVYPRRL